jgi:hypothetical protein
MALKISTLGVKMGHNDVLWLARCGLAASSWYVYVPFKAQAQTPCRLCEQVCVTPCAMLATHALVPPQGQAPLGPLTGTQVGDGWHEAWLEHEVPYCALYMADMVLLASQLHGQHVLWFGPVQPIFVF